MNQKSSCSPELLLQTLRAALPTEPALRERVQTRLAVSLVGLPPAVTTGGESPLVGQTTAGKSGVGHVAGNTALAGKSFAVAWLAPVFIAGALVGAAADRWFVRPHEQATHLPALDSSATAAPRELLANSEPVAVETAQVEQLVLERKSPVTPSAAVPSVANPTAKSLETGSSMAEERQLLDAARKALARGEPDAGIASLEMHVKRYPKGMLTEEREALYVRVLAAAGRDGAASARAAGFRQRFPNSIFLPVVERAQPSISRQKEDNGSN